MVTGCTRCEARLDARNLNRFNTRLPLRRRQCAAQQDPSGRVAQLVEQGIENPRVGGSIPSPATTFPCKSIAVTVRGRYYRRRVFALFFWRSYTGITPVVAISTLVNCSRPLAPRWPVLSCRSPPAVQAFDERDVSFKRLRRNVPRSASLDGLDLAERQRAISHGLCMPAALNEYLQEAKHQCWLSPNIRCRFGDDHLRRCKVAPQSRRCSETLCFASKKLDVSNERVDAIGEDRQRAGEVCGRTGGQRSGWCSRQCLVRSERVIARCSWWRPSIPASHALGGRAPAWQDLQAAMGRHAGGCRENNRRRAATCYRRRSCSATRGISVQ